MPRFGRSLVTPALLLLITIGFFWKLVLTRQYTWLDQPDHVTQVTPLFQMQALQWHNWHFPLWDPHSWAGQPVVGQVQTGTLNPYNWIFFSLPLHRGYVAVQTLHWYWVLIHFLGVLFCYWLCRDLSLSRAASILGGCAFGLGGYVGAVGQPHFMMSAVLMPLVLMFFLRVLRGQKVLASAASSGAMLGASFLMGHHNIPIFFTLAMMGLWIYYYAVVRRSLRWNALIPLVAFMACFGLIAAAQLLPARELGKLSVRWVGASEPLTLDQRVPYTVHDEYSLYPTALLAIVIQGFQHGSSGFIGFMALWLALLGAATRWRQPEVPLLGAVGLGALLFSLGAISVFHGFLYAVVPGLDKARSPSTAEAIFHLGVAVLAAYGLDSLRSSMVPEKTSRLAVRVLGAIAFVLFAALVIMISLRAETGQEYTFLAATAFIALLVGGLLQAWSREMISARTGTVLAILLLLFELNTVTNYAHKPIVQANLLAKLFQNADIVNFLKRRPEMVRVEVDSDEIPYSFGDWFDIDQLGGMQAAIVTSINKVQGDPRFRMLLATNYYIGPKQLRPDQTQVFEGQSGLKVFENPAAFPRARMLHVAVTEPNEGAVAATVNNPATDLQRTVVLPGSAVSLEACYGGTVQIERYKPASVTLLANAPCRAMVVLADTWFPGWKAYVDGREVEIYKAYNTLRGVVVDSGQHRIVMVYRPASVFIGLALGALGILLWFVLQRVRTKPYSES